MEQTSKLSALAQTYFPSSEENADAIVETATVGENDGQPTFAELGLNPAILSALATAGGASRHGLRQSRWRVR